ncbi:MAG: HlyD family efflux transporter periplasmic adaptor subunit [Clostridiales bacterium]|nr:HlyD family efflux transporter periplasmic adaptor subunit [Clostridiales bacterium]
MALAAPAGAEGELSLTGTLQPDRILAITAPFSATVIAARADAGDLVRAGEILFELETTKVYAPCDGTVAGLRAAEGDRLADVAAVYPAPLYIEPTSRHVINASTSGAYDKDANRYIHVGETVYLTSTASSSRSGEGIVTSVDGADYTVEVQSGSLRLNENCRISRNPDSDESKDRIGSGKTRRNNPVAVVAEGSVLKLHVAEGDQVKKGDLLMEVAQGDLPGGAGGWVTTDQDCVVQSVSAGVGDAVQRGQALATVFPVGTLVAAVPIDESDLPAIAVGDNVTIELDATADGAGYRGTVRSIAYAADAGAASPTYRAIIEFENDGFVRQGMGVTVRKGG